MDRSESLVEIADSILYISSLLADQPRAIDQVIDYFGETPRGREEAVRHAVAS
jgi:hypothetical protein